MPRGIPFPLLTAALFQSLAGCVEPHRGAEVERTWVGDTVVVHSHRPENPDTLEMREVLRIGELDGPEEYRFTDIGRFAIGPSGDILVGDRDGIRRFSSDGIFQDWLARRGEGPGEVMAAAGMDVSSQRLIAIQDVGNRRISIFHPDGSVVIVPGPQGKATASDEDALLFHPDGTLWVKFHPWWPPPGGITHPRAIYARIDAENRALVDTVFTPADAAEECPTLTENPWSQGGWLDTREPWVPMTMWAWGPDGTFALGCPATYQFTVTKPSGEILKIRRDWTPVPEVRDAIEFRERWTDFKDLPPTLPAYAQIILPGDGRVWVWPSQPSRKVEARPHLVEIFGITEEWVLPITGAFDVFAPDGHWVAVVKPPDGVEYSGYITRDGVLIRGDTMWAVAKDALDVNYLVRAEIVWPGLKQ